jgi:hypothetical protein
MSNSDIQRILNQREIILNERVEYIKQVLKEEKNEGDIKWLNRQLRGTEGIMKREKLRSEIHFLYKLARIGFKIRILHRPDVIAEKGSMKYKIELYQPDESQSNRIKEKEKTATKFNFGRGIEGRGYTIAFTQASLLKEIISNCIDEKKEVLLEMAEDKNSIIILCIDHSDRKMIEKIFMSLDSRPLEFANLTEIKASLNVNERMALDGVIISTWRDSLMKEKVGILVNNYLGEEQIGVLKKVLHLTKVI